MLALSQRRRILTRVTNTLRPVRRRHDRYTQDEVITVEGEPLAGQVARLSTDGGGGGSLPLGIGLT